MVAVSAGGHEIAPLMAASRRHAWSEAHAIARLRPSLSGSLASLARFVQGRRDPAPTVRKWSFGRDRRACAQPHADGCRTHACRAGVPSRYSRNRRCCRTATTTLRKHEPGTRRSVQTLGAGAERGLFQKLRRTDEMAGEPRSVRSRDDRRPPRIRRRAPSAVHLSRARPRHDRPCRYGRTRHACHR